MIPATFTSTLSDDELYARIVAAGSAPQQARYLVRHRDEVREDAWPTWLGKDDDK